MYWNLIVITLSSLLIIFLLWKEIQHSGKHWLAARIIASVFAVISLAMLVLPVTINQKQNAGDPEISILLTEGFNTDSVQNFFKVNGHTKVFTTQKNVTDFNAVYITDVSAFGESSDNAKAVHIFGFGLDENELSLLKNTPVIFHPGVISNRITAISWTQHLVSGEPLVVQGSFKNTSSLPAKVILNGFNSNLDSINLGAKQTSYFRLNATPKFLEKAVYSVVVLSGKDTLEMEPIPVEVEATQPFSILVLAGSPDFENKFLKNWLAKNKFRFAVRTTISKNKYDHQYVNMPAVSPDQITSSFLDKFDVLLADASELAVLPASYLATIKYYIENKGLGLIIKTDSAGNSPAFYLRSFPLTENTDSTQRAIKLRLSNSSFDLFPLKSEQPVYIRNISGTQTLVKDQQMHIVVNSKAYGLGKIVLTTIMNTYSWQLSGSNNDYSSYWSLLLKKAAKKAPLDEVWNINPILPQENEEVHLKLQTAKANIPQIQIDGQRVNMEQNYYLPYEWNATFWPTTTGWQSITSDEGSTYWWYAYNTAQWKGIKARDKMRATNNYVNGHPYSPKNASAGYAMIAIEVPKIYFFILFILCSGFLWAAQKLRADK